MGKRCKDPGVGCPFYCSEDESKIYCEGFEQGEWTHHAWMDGKKKKAWKKNICKHDWQSCPWARTLDKIK